MYCHQKQPVLMINSSVAILAIIVYAISRNLLTKEFKKGDYYDA